MAKDKERVVKEPKKDIELKKHVAMIHSSNRLSLLQRKVANALLFNAYKDLMHKDEHEIHVATLCKLIGYDSHDYKTIKKSLVNLLSTVLEWNLVDGAKVDSEGVWNASSVIADASIDGPICTYSYSNKMKKLLHRPAIYGRLDMMVQARFQSSYGLALYENCNRYQDIGQSPWFDIGQFRKLMGVDEGKYKVFRDFKSRVLDKAVEEVNAYSPIRVEPKLRRVKQKVVAIQFLIKKAVQVKTDTSGTYAIQLGDVLKLDYGLSKRQTTDVMKQFSESYIREKIMLIEGSASFQSGKIKNLAKYLMTALKEDYQLPKTAKKQAIAGGRTVTKKTESKADLLDFSDPKNKKTRELAEQYNRYVHSELIKITQSMLDSDRNKIIGEFEEHLTKSSRGIYNDLYFRDGLTNPLVQDQLVNFIRRQKPELVSLVLSYEHWQQQHRLMVVG